MNVSEIVYVLSGYSDPPFHTRLHEKDRKHVNIGTPAWICHPSPAIHPTRGPVSEKRNIACSELHEKQAGPQSVKFLSRTRILENRSNVP
jgi:hypothetical protein